MTSSVKTYEAIVDEMTWHRVQALIATSTRSNAVKPGQRRTHTGVRRAEPTRYPLAGMVVCDCCGKKLQGNMVRGHAFYRCKVSADYPVAVNIHPPSLSVREDRLLPHVNAWLSELFAPERIEATATQVAAAHIPPAALRRSSLPCRSCVSKTSIPHPGTDSKHAV